MSVSLIIEISFDGGCVPNPGMKYGSFEVRHNGDWILGKNRAKFGYGTSNEAEFNALQMALSETITQLSLFNDPKIYSLRVKTDSTIVRNRLMRKNQTRKSEPQMRMSTLAAGCLLVMDQFKDFTVEWNSRIHNVARFGH